MDVVLITAAALLVFHIPFRGSLLLLFFCSVLFLMTSLGAGLFLSTISQTQQQAMMANFFFSTPAFMLSGFAFPDPQHAGGGAVSDLSEPAALLHGDRARDVSEGRGRGGAVAADGVRWPCTA